MKRILFISLCLLMSVTTLLASGAMRKETRKIGKFSSIKVANGIRVFLTNGNSDKAVIESNIEDFRDINISSSGSALTISLSPFDKRSNAVFKNVSVNVYLSTKTINAIGVSSSGSVTSEDKFTGKSLNIKASSAGAVKMNIDMNEVDVESSSSSNVKLRGNINELDINSSSASSVDYDGKAQKVEVESSSSSSVNLKDVSQNAQLSASSAAKIKVTGVSSFCEASTSSSGFIDASAFVCEEVVAKASSGSTLKVNAVKKMQATASSGAKIYYKGSPVITQTLSSGAKLVKF